jgi:type IV secretory pathway VirB10-like protein
MEDSDVCAHCGQPMPGRKVVTYGQRGPNRTGMVVTIALHLLLVAVWLFQPKAERHAPPKSGAAVVWLPPLKPNKPAAKPAEQAPKKTAKAEAPKFTPPRITMPRLPNTITVPEVKPVEEKPQPKPKEETKAPPQEVDMQAYIEAQRKKRGAPAQTDQAEESEATRGTRNALANIAAINGRGGQDPNETEGMFDIKNKTFNSADIKFKVWNSNFKRRWLTSVTVERGSEPDIETAIVKKMIEMIRKETKGDFTWRDERTDRVYVLSARPEDTQELMNFLYKQMFHDYKPPR